jgi:hypothetical protein
MKEKGSEDGRMESVVRAVEEGLDGPAVVVEPEGEEAVGDVGEGGLAAPETSFSDGSFQSVYVSETVLIERDPASEIVKFNLPST